MGPEPLGRSEPLGTFLAGEIGMYKVDRFGADDSVQRWTVGLEADHRCLDQVRGERGWPRHRSLDEGEER